MFCNYCCPACGYDIAEPFYDGGKQPLATLAWPSSQGEAQNMEMLPLFFYCCVDCGHIYNPEFDYSKVPYNDKPNLMFNRGVLWRQYLQVIGTQIIERLPSQGVVVEIGCGDGYFLDLLAQRQPQHRYLGFDVNISNSNSVHQSIEFFKMLFDPEQHLEEYRPNMIICRHVLEHFERPAAFVQMLSMVARKKGIPISLFLEVPCVDVAVRNNRVADFFYEHPSHFTTNSFKRMLQRSVDEIEIVSRSYDDEVVYSFAKIGVQSLSSCVTEADNFFNNSQEMYIRCTQDLDILYRSNKKVVFWGGSGKSAAFMNFYGIDMQRFPYVVDSDRDKVGSFVAGCGQQIYHSTKLIDEPADIIVITTKWRAKDIYEEIQQLGITYETILIEDNGRLVSIESKTLVNF